MSLKAKLDEAGFTALPDVLKEHYTKASDGSYLLSAEGVEDVSGLKATVSAVRGEKKTVEDALKALQQQFEGVNVDEYRKWLNDSNQNAELKLIKEGKIEDVINARTERMRQDHANALKAAQKAEADLKEAIGKTTSQLHAALLDAKVAAIAPKVGVRPTAIPDLMTRASRVYKVEEGKLVPYRDDGTILYGKTGGKPIEVDEWIATLTSDAPHLFEANRGTATPGGTTQQVGNAIRLTRDQARDPNQYREAKENAQKAGLSLEIVE